MPPRALGIGRRLTGTPNHGGVLLAARLGLLAVVFFGIGAPQLAVALHLCFSAHEHRFCAEHKQIEDVPARRTVDAPTLARRAGLDAIAPAGALWDSRPHIMCALSNVHPAACTLLPAPDGAWLAATADAVVLQFDRQALHPACQVFAFAPKRSPPSLEV